jgi:hypothetical protein
MQHGLAKTAILISFAPRNGGRLIGLLVAVVGDRLATFGYDPPGLRQ